MYLLFFVIIITKMIEMDGFWSNFGDVIARC